MKNRKLAYKKSAAGNAFYKIEDDTIQIVTIDRETDKVKKIDAYKPQGEPSFPSLVDSTREDFEEHFNRA